MKTFLTFIALLLYASISSAQIDQQTPLTWMKGDNTINQTGVYGTTGIAHINNKPGARNGSTTWRDSNGQLWLLGGSGYGASNVGYLNDLWKFNPSTNAWSWMKGDSAIGQFSVYGTKGVSDAANKPGGTYASVSWTDTNGSLWLFGGFGYTNDAFGFLNSLWKYNTTSNEWTWVNGDTSIDQVGVYGTKGVPDATNKPGARYGSRTWVDANGHLWLYGGYGYDTNTSGGILNDIWKYNPATNEWTWINGDNMIDQVGVYGIKGITNATNKPGARYVSTSWTDTNGDLWLFGGYGYDETEAGNLNDLWKYNVTSNEWTWINGNKIINQPGIYGIQSEPHANNQPGARYISSSWIDGSGELWLFGGYGLDTANSGYLNDLWKYSPVTNQWVWVKGDNTIDQLGVYGVQGMAAPTNKSGARVGSVSWTDGTGNLWLFGGYGFDGNTSGVLNDLWKITNLQAVLPLHLLHFSGVLNNETVLLQWETEQENNFSHFNIQRSFDGINYTNIAAINGAGNSYRNHYRYTDSDLKNRPSQKIFYRLQLMDKDSTYTYSKILRFDFNKQGITFTVFPNPAVHSLNISFAQKKTGKVVISITDMKGVTIKKQTQTIVAGRASTYIDVSSLVTATYIISITNETGTALQKFIKQ